MKVAEKFTVSWHAIEPSGRGGGQISGMGLERDFAVGGADGDDGIGV
jgi:hypothetical protein